ncbi:MAG: hypothetical protein KAT48_12955 [Bacteroidales bacterium]|nr:hypothetical protein [Bacteroidales bacterium]
MLIFYQVRGEENNTNNYRFGIMCSGYHFHQWKAKTIQFLIDYGHEPSLLIIDDRPDMKMPFVKRLWHYPYAKFLFRIYNRFFFKPASRQLVSLESLLKGVPNIRCRVEEKGFSEIFTDQDVERIKSHNLDFVLRFGFNIIRGGILQSARFGIWSFHHADEQKYRGGPPGFWEIYFRDNVNGAILQRLTNRLDAGYVLRKGYFKTIHHSWPANLDRLHFESARWPSQVAEDLKNGVLDPDNLEPSSSTAKIYHFPGNGKMLWFLFQSLYNKLSFHYHDLFKAEKWNIGIITKPVSELMQPNLNIEPLWLQKPPSGSYYADPFGFFDDGNFRILYEDYNFKEAKAKISCVNIEPGSGKIIKIKPCIEELHHLAYPFLFTEQGETYCMPESADDSQVVLYRYDKNSDSFVQHGVLLHDMDAVDATLIRYESKWWLFFTRKHLSDTHLYVYYADVLTGEYQPHKNNPVKTDVRSARPAGLPFVIGGTLFRPAQNCSKTYGGSTIINRVSVLSPENFKEEKVNEIKPFQNTVFNKGTHTLSAVGDFTLIDGKYFVFSYNQFFQRLRRKLSKKLHV